VRHTQNIGITRPLAPPNTSTTVLFEKEGKLAEKWNGWPDGFFERDFTFHEVDDYNNLQVHWATKTHGHRGGFDSADSWEHGKKQHRECLTFDTHMAGKKPKIPKGFIIWEAIYSLRGGLMAQEKFYQIRIKKYAAQYNLSFSEATLDKLPTVSYHQAGFREMDKKDHVWLLQPERKGTTEYISNPIPSLPLAPDGPESEEKTDIHPASQVSLPDSDFALNCCCGAVSNANIAYHQDDGEAVQCNECRDWSHVACQQDGRVSSLGKNEIFLCDSCDLAPVATTLYYILKANACTGICFQPGHSKI